MSVFAEHFDNTASPELEETSGHDSKRKLSLFFTWLVKKVRKHVLWEGKKIPSIRTQVIAHELIFGQLRVLNSSHVAFSTLPPWPVPPLPFEQNEQPFSVELETLPSHQERRKALQTKFQTLSVP
mmetsp:Transcript_29888/g.55238  ORF Transcript_29888/g.55238 Transcript_29888/m.55238 type:complete len:125 (+) Transcript_29888:22-396(+)